jgi:anaphase-promoting complex subunit 4
MHQIATRTTTEPFIPALTAYCPTMDLIATVTEKGNVDVWRLNGQRVFGGLFKLSDIINTETGETVPAEPGCPVKEISWRRDGQVLAIVCADGMVSLLNAFTGKVAHRFTIQNWDLTEKKPDELCSRPSISAISWTTHFTYPSPRTIQCQLESSEKGVVLDQLLSLRADIGKLLNLKADLPHHLGQLDIETSLPKLSTLPPTGVGADDDVFSSRASVDTIFHDEGNNSKALGDVDVLAVASNDGLGCRVHIRLFDSFEVGTVILDGVLSTHKDGTVKVIKISSHPFLSTLYLLLEHSNPKAQGSSSLHLVSLDLNFVRQTGCNLGLVARKATQLSNLIRYISQVEKQLYAEVKAAFDLPSRFLGNVNESLAEEDPISTFGVVAHQLAVTGECDPKLKEWLVDEVGERGLKRWEKAVSDCLEVVRRMTSECLLPALERCLVVLSRLDGLARYSPTSSKLGLEERNVRDLRATTELLSVMAEELLLDVGLEMREFAAFMRWMKWECEVEALEEGSERAEELRESWTGEAELKLALDYIGGAMQESRLMRYLIPDYDQREEHAAASQEVSARSSRTTPKKAATSSKKKRVHPLAGLVSGVDAQSHTIFECIADTFRKSIMTNHMLKLPGQCADNGIDMQIIPDELDSDLYRLHALYRDPQSNHQFRHVVAALRQNTGRATKSSMDMQILSIPRNEEILDVRFADDQTLLALASKDSATSIYSCDISAAAERKWQTRHIFEHGQMAFGVRPGSLDVNGHVGRRAVCVLDRGGLGYTVFDLDAEDIQQSNGADSLMNG